MITSPRNMGNATWQVERVQKEYERKYGVALSYDEAAKIWMREDEDKSRGNF